MTGWLEFAPGLAIHEDELTFRFVRAQTLLTCHARGILAIDTLYDDFRNTEGFTAFAETAEPEEIMEVLSAYHLALGELVFAYEGTLEHFAGDGHEQLGDGLHRFGPHGSGFF